VKIAHEVVVQRESMQRAEARKRMAEIPNTDEGASLPCGPVGCTPFPRRCSAEPASVMRCIVYFKISGRNLRKVI